MVGTGFGACPSRGMAASANAAASKEKISLKGEERSGRASFVLFFSLFLLPLKGFFSSLLSLSFKEVSSSSFNEFPFYWNFRCTPSDSFR
jgi:hypothetical protein